MTEVLTFFERTAHYEKTPIMSLELELGTENST